MVFFLLPNKEEIYESKIVHKTLNPIFDQVFEFGGILPQEIRRQTIMFRVYDHDRYTSSGLIGVVALSLKEADLYGVSMKMRIDEKEEFKVRGCYISGVVTLSTRFVPRLFLKKGRGARMREGRSEGAFKNDPGTHQVHVHVPIHNAYKPADCVFLHTLLIEHGCKIV